VAKKKGATGRARASRKKAAKKRARPQAETQTETLSEQMVAGVEVATEASAVEGPETDNRAILDGAELQRLLTLAAAQGATQALAAQEKSRSADSERIGRIEVALTAMDQRLGVLANRLGETASAQPSNPEGATAASTSAARLASDTRGAAVHAWRQSLWISETNQSKQLPKPRPTIVGRALADLGATSRDGGEVTIVQVFRKIHASGRHHLDQGAVRNLESAASDDKSVRNRATSGLSKLFETRFNRLKKAQLAYGNADRRWLTATGRDVFNGWPGWRVEHDDEECEGEERLARRRPEATDDSAADAPGAPPAVSAEGGSASAASE
jgi:hypothetical protein